MAAKIYDYLNFGRIASATLEHFVKEDPNLSKYRWTFTEERLISHDGLCFHAEGYYLGFTLCRSLMISGLAMMSCSTREAMVDLLDCEIGLVMAELRNQAALNEQLLEWARAADVPEETSWDDPEGALAWGTDHVGVHAYADEVYIFWEPSAALDKPPETATEIAIKEQLAEQAAAAFTAQRRTGKSIFESANSIIKEAFQARGDQVADNVTKNNALLQRLRARGRKK